MVITGRIFKGQVVLDGNVNLPEGATVRVEVNASVPEPPPPDENGRTLGEKLMRYAGILKGLPTDLAQNHDFYAHGTPKR